MAFETIGHNYGETPLAVEFPSVSATDILKGQLVEISTTTTLTTAPGHVVELSGSQTSGASVAIVGVAAEARTGSATRSTMKVYIDPNIIFKAPCYVDALPVSGPLVADAGGNITTLIDATWGTSAAEDLLIGSYVKCLTLAAPGLNGYNGQRLLVSDYATATGTFTLATLGGTGTWTAADTYAFLPGVGFIGYKDFAFDATMSVIDLGAAAVAARNPFVCVGFGEDSPQGGGYLKVSLRNIPGFVIA